MTHVQKLQVAILGILVGLCLIGREMWVVYISLAFYVPLAVTIFSITRLIVSRDDFVRSLMNMKKVILNDKESLTFRKQVWYTYNMLEKNEFANVPFYLTVATSVLIYTINLYAAFNIDAGLLQIASVAASIIGLIVLGVGIEVRAFVLRVMGRVGIPSAAKEAGLV